MIYFYRTFLPALVGLVVVCGTGCESDEATRISQSNTDDSETTDDNSDDDTGKIEQQKDSEEPGVVQPEVLPPVPQCVKECSEPADCVEVGADKLHRAANFDCDDGTCKYLGCTSAANCTEVYAASDYICSEQGECLYPCDSAADCALAEDDVDENNWRCQNGGCVSLGCNDSLECARAYGYEYVCADVMHKGLKQCQKSCNTPADCVLNIDREGGAYDADNYQCLNIEVEAFDVCDYVGCADDAECGAGYKCTLTD